MIIVAIFGLSGSGKTSLANKLRDFFKNDLSVDVISQDSYYYDVSSLSKAEFDLLNFDHPDQINFDLLLQQLTSLKQNQSIQVPCSKVNLSPPQLLIVEGILLMAHAELAKLFDLIIYVDVPLEEALHRRQKRDFLKNQLNYEYANKFYHSKILPMAREFILANQSKAHVSTENEEKNPFNHFLLVVNHIKLKLGLGSVKRVNQVSL